MSEQQLPSNVNYIFVPKSLAINTLRSILRGIESDSITHPIDPTYPTNSWVVHVYAAINNADQHGYAILYDIPPVDDDGQHPVQVSLVQGATDDEKVKNAALLVGRGNDLIGYEDLSGSDRAVIFRNAHAMAPPTNEPQLLSWDSAVHPERKDWSAK